jgi:hypothetical protein
MMAVVQPSLARKWVVALALLDPRNGMLSLGQMRFVSRLNAFCDVVKPT